MHLAAERSTHRLDVLDDDPAPLLRVAALGEQVIQEGTLLGATDGTADIEATVEQLGRNPNGEKAAGAREQD